MRKERIRIYFLEILLILSLISILFSNKYNNRIILSIILAIFAIIITIIIKKKNQLSLNKKNVFKILTILGLLYICLYYTLGIYSGFYKAVHKFNFNTLIKFIIPLSVIIVSSELIRSKLLTKKDKLSIAFCYLISVLIDIAVYSNIYDLSSHDEFLLSIGYLLFASISCNLLFNYISIRYGSKPIIVYRLITTLYLYIIPITPDVYIFFKSFFRVLYPLIIYTILESNYGQVDDTIVNKKKTILGYCFNVFSVFIMVLYVGLISCHFRFGALVIGSGSMTGTINKGDVIVFDNKIDFNNLKEGDIIVFDKDGVTLVHRLIKIRSINDKKLYYTKGDNNLSEDQGYRTESDIKGIVNFKVSRIGKPTLWFYDLFEKKE